MEADTGVSRTVTIDSSAVDYLDVNKVRDISQLTINDYTLLSNSQKVVSMSDNVPQEADAEALVVVNQVAYNTNYGIDFLKDGESLSQEKVYTATKLSISPGSFEEDDEGGCSLADSDNFVKELGDKVGLGFTVTTACQSKLETDQEPGVAFPAAVQGSIPQPQIYFTALHGNPNAYGVGSYLYANVSTTNGNLVVKVECRVNKKFSGSGNRYDYISAAIQDYTPSGQGNKKQPWKVGDGGLHIAGGAVAQYTVTSVNTTNPTPIYNYKSVYTTKVQLTNGGINWRVGDKVTVSMSGKSYTITVTGESFGYSYVSEASVSYTTALNTESGTLDVSSITAGLVSEINELGNYNAQPVGNVIYIQRTDGKDFNIQTRGGTTNNALYGIKNSVNDVTLLPNQCVPGVTLLVRNSAQSDADDYFVRFKAATGDIPGQGAWEETVKPGIPTDLNLSTMPVAMIRKQMETLPFVRFLLSSMMPFSGQVEK